MRLLTADKCTVRPRSAAHAELEDHTEVRREMM
eukprot:SAG11_NODE_36697_length_260_cov_0.931677_1_plen_32_part_10